MSEADLDALMDGYVEPKRLPDVPKINLAGTYTPAPAPRPAPASGGAPAYSAPPPYYPSGRGQEEECCCGIL
jgi:hypothetical protein